MTNNPSGGFGYLDETEAPAPDFANWPHRCEHDWRQDPNCDLVDICDKCGEERA